jgi:hypothetical protein
MLEKQAILAVLFLGAPVALAQGGALGHRIMCGNQKQVYTDEPGSNEHTVLLNQPYSDAAARAYLESQAADDYECTGKCPDPDKSPCHAETTSTGSIDSHQATTVNGQWLVTTTGFTVTFKCPCPTEE